MPIQAKVPLPPILPVKTWKWMVEVTESKIDQLRIDLQIEQHLLEYFEFRARKDKED